jgi:ATP/maltotriose-dependent transcriptional regulator MalT
MEVLEGELRRIRTGRFRLCLIEGSAGVGKSRLMSEVLARNRDELRVLSARSYRLGHTASFGPWLEALDRYALSHDRREIRELVGVETGEAPERDVLLERLTSILGELGRNGPTLVAIDDVHLADQSSWEALRFVARRLHEHSVGVLATARSGGLAPNALAADVLHALADDGCLRRVTVRPLNPDEVSALVRERLAATGEASAGIPHALVQWLNDRSLGHPLFVLSLLDALLGEGADLTAPNLTEVPSTLRERIALGLPILDRKSRQMLDVLAVWDRRAKPEELAQALHWELEKAGEALEALCRSRLVEEQSTGGGYLYEVAHPLIQESVYELIGGARRMALHRSAARVLLARGRWGAAAAHFARSATTADDESVDALCRAISDAESKGLYREALTILSDLPELIEPGNRRWLRVLDSLTWQADWVVDHLVEGDAEGAIVAMRRIEEVTQRDGDPMTRGSIQFHLASFLAIGAGRLNEAESACRNAVELFRAAGEPHRELLARNEMVWISSCTGELERAVRLAREILDVEDQTGPLVVNQAAGSAAYALGLLGRFEESERHYELADEVADANGMRYRQIWGLVQRSHSRALQGRLPEAVSAVERAMAMDHGMACDALALERLALCRWLEGDLAECVRLIDDSGARRAVRGSRRRAWGLAVAARALAEMGRSHRAERYLAQARETYTGDEILDWSAWCAWSLGYLRFLEVELDEAARLFEQTVARYRAMGAVAAEALVLLDVTELAVTVDDDSLADSTAARLRNISNRSSGPLRAALADLAEGVADMLRGSGNGEAFINVARRLEESGYALPAEAAMHFGGVTLTGTDTDKAVELFERAARVAHSAGATRRRDRSLRLLRKMGAPGKRAVGSVLGLQSLTPREREVAELAARGYTAAQIADRLFIGRRTVESHLAHAYPKLGVSSKQELVIRADDLGLGDAAP